MGASEAAEPIVAHNTDRPTDTGGDFVIPGTEQEPFDPSKNLGRREGEDDEAAAARKAADVEKIKDILAKRSGEAPARVEPDPETGLPREVEPTGEKKDPPKLEADDIPGGDKKPAGEKKDQPGEGDDAPKLSDKEREALKRAFPTLGDEGIDALPVAQAKTMAEAAVESRRQLDDLQRRNTELANGAAGTEAPDSGGTATPTPVDPSEPDSELQRLREQYGDDAAADVDKFVASKVAEQQAAHDERVAAQDQRIAELEGKLREESAERAEEAKARAQARAKRTIMESFQRLSGELPELRDSERAYDVLESTLVGLAQTGDFESADDLVRAAYGAKYVTRLSGNQRQAEHLMSQPDAPTDGGGDADAPRDAAQRDRAYFDLIDAGVPGHEARRRLGMS